MDWLAFLMRLRATDMPIQRMQEFARLRSEGNGTATARRKMLEGHFSEVTAKIQELQKSAQVLTAKIEFYRQLEQVPSQSTPLLKRNEHATKPLRTRTRQTAGN
jgi:DNA-binding transcriptional MerR regulator